MCGSKKTNCGNMSQYASVKPWFIERQGGFESKIHQNLTRANSKIQIYTTEFGMLTFWNSKHFALYTSIPICEVLIQVYTSMLTSVLKCL